MISVQKQLLRQKMRALFKEKNKEAEHQQNNRDSFVRELVALSRWNEATAVLLYAPLLGEPNLLSLLDQFPERRFFFPRLEKQELHLYQWHLGASWIVNHYGVLEPNPQEWERVPTYDVDVALIPGMAFDQAGGRLGRGAGFYDRLLSAPEWRGYKVGVAWPWQFVSSVPCEAHDIRMDVVVSVS